MTEARSVVSSRTARRVGQVVLVLAVGYVVYGQVSTQVEANEAASEKETAQSDANQARQDARSVADPLAELCARDAEVRRRVGSLCDKAAEVKDAPTATPRDGQDGRGIAATRIDSGRLVITYTDGVIEDKGPVVTKGAPGKAGQNGRSIIATTVQDGALVLSYSDGTTETAGRVVGEAGREGRGISAVAVSADSRLIITYTDGTTVDVGPLPPGPPGPEGRGVASVAFDFDSCQATVTYTDGTSEPAPMTGCEPPATDPSGPADPPGGLLPGGG